MGWFVSKKSCGDFLCTKCIIEFSRHVSYWPLHHDLSFHYTTEGFLFLNYLKTRLGQEKWIHSVLTGLIITRRIFHLFSRRMRHKTDSCRRERPFSCRNEMKCHELVMIHQIIENWPTKKSYFRHIISGTQKLVNRSTCQIKSILGFGWAEGRICCWKSPLRTVQWQWNPE